MKKENVHEIDKIMEITNCIVETVHPQKVILFGSFARGEDTKHSDYDLCVLTDDINHDDFDTQYFNIQNAIKEINQRQVDLIMKTKKKYNKNKECRAYVDYYIDKEGVILYEC